MRRKIAIVAACLGFVLLAGCAQVNEGLGLLHEAGEKAREKGREAAATFVDTRCETAGTDYAARKADLEAINEITESGDWVAGFDCDGDGKPDVVVTPAEPDPPEKPKEVSNLGNGNSIEPGTNRLAYWRGGDGRERDYSALSDAGEKPGIGPYLVGVEYPRREYRQEPERRRHLA